MGGGSHVEQEVFDEDEDDDEDDEGKHLQF